MGVWVGGGGQNVAGARRVGGVGGGELQFERDADALRLSGRRPADLSAGPPARGRRRGAAGLGRQRLLDRRRGTSAPPPLPNRAVFYGSFPGPLRLSSRDKKLKVGGKLRTRSSGCLPADVRIVPSAGPSRLYCRLWCQSMRCPSNVSFSTPPSCSARLGLGRGSTDRVWLFQFGQDGAGAGFWGFSGLLGKMLDFRFLLGIFCHLLSRCRPFLGGGGGVFLGEMKDGASTLRFPSQSRTFLRRLFLSPVFETCLKEKGNLWNCINVFLPKSLYPKNLTVILQSPPFLGSSLGFDAEGKGLFVFPFSDFFFSRSFYQFLLDNSWMIWASDAFNFK